MDFKSVSPLLTITGPTGSGKSSSALDLAQHFSAEIVNADSVQMYRGFEIGASQPTAADKQRCVHHLYGVLDPRQRSDVAEFIQLADDVVDELHRQQTIALLVGGSGMYVRSLFHGLAEIPDVPQELVLQKQLELSAIEKESDSRDDYFARVETLLKERDLRAAQLLHPSDTQRIVRALAVLEYTGKSLIEFQQEHAQGDKRFGGIVVYIEPDRQELYRRIDQRVLDMWKQGLVEEVQKLLSEYGDLAHAMGSIGYRHVCNFLKGEWSQEQAVELMQRDTRRFAKRQMTWWRNQPEKLSWTNRAFTESLIGIGEIEREYSRLADLEGESTEREIVFIPCRGITA